MAWTQSENWGFNLNPWASKGPFRLYTHIHAVCVCIQLVRKRRPCSPNVRLIWDFGSVVTRATVNESIKLWVIRWFLISFIFDNYMGLIQASHWAWWAKGSFPACWNSGCFGLLRGGRLALLVVGWGPQLGVISNFKTSEVSVFPIPIARRITSE